MATASGTKLMALCTLAVGAIYAAGYVYTEPAAQATGPASAVAGASAHAKVTAKSSTNSSAPTKAVKKMPAVKYNDGTYTGSGSNPYGTLSVAVTIAGGRITGVKITNYNMHYPQYVIDPQMNNEVVSMQTYRVYIVSGATASSYNFAEAVYNALQKAKA
jgi:uncharacterized protein with FMN-binding domain